MTNNKFASILIVNSLLMFVSACVDTALSTDNPETENAHTAYTEAVVPGRRIAYSEPREPCAVYNPTRDPFFGDLHVHTARSLDAGIQDTRTTPYQAYQFAKGERIGIQPWIDNDTSARTLQLGRPLDFAMASDHAEFFGEQRICTDPEADGDYNSYRCKQFRKDPQGKFVSWNFQYLASEPSNGPMSRFLFCGKNGKDCLGEAVTVWNEEQVAAEAAYDKTSNCEFTAFIGYEHTGSPGSENMHRNVVFKNSHVPAEALSYIEYSQPENLWKGLDNACNESHGCESLTIPHNSNVSGDRMFRRGKAWSRHNDFDAEYVSLRNEYEPLMEIYQHKGGSECVRDADEFCNFEKFPFNNLIADRFDGLLSNEPNEDSFLRYALTEGLNQGEEHGTNPFKYGVVGSTDTHLGTPGAVSEDNFPGHGGAGGGDASNGLTDSIAFSGGGLAVLWAEENSRDYLFDSMQRKESYATSGPRMLVRLFGGWDYPANMCDSVVYDETGIALKRGPFVETGYAGGVPMGSDLPARSGTQTAPMFAVAALRDPGFDTANPESDLYEPGNDLQRIQIVKGWVDNSGKHHEQVYDVAGGDNGASVNLDTGEPQGDGADELCAVWQDPGFNADQNAFYYARVLENPTSRWSWKQCLAYLEDSPFSSFESACSNTSQLDEGYQHCCLHDHIADTNRNIIEEWQMGTYPAELQERAWSSPIWYEASSSYQEIKTTVGGEEKCLDIEGGDMSNGTVIKAWDCHGGSNQQWNWDPVSQHIRSLKDKSFCLDNRGVDYNGAALHIWECQNSDNLRFTFENGVLRSKAHPAFIVTANMNSSNVELFDHVLNDSLHSQNWIQGGQ